jgi:superfamily II DNA or RNA helicase
MDCEEEENISDDDIFLPTENKDEIQSKKLLELLQTSYGYPSKTYLKLKDIKKLCTENIESKLLPCNFETVCGAVYWIQKSKNWAFEQIWGKYLICTPIKNALANSYDEENQTFSVFYENAQKPDWIGIPKFLGLSLFGLPTKDIRSFGNEFFNNVEFDITRTLRNYQILAKQNALLDLEKWGGSTIIADCGAGKTCMGLSIACELKRKTLIICNRSFLMQQWKLEIEGEPQTIENPAKLSWLKNANVGWIQGPKVDIEQKDFVVASIDSLSQCSYSPEILKQFGLVIIDEMHHLAAKTLSTVLPKIPSRYILGITATPDRNDGLEYLLYWLSGPTSFVYKRVPEVTGIYHSVEICQQTFSQGTEKEIYYKNGKLGFASMVSALAKEEKRNQFIKAIIKELIPKRKKILIVTSIVEHAKYLGSEFQCEVIYGGCKASQVLKAKSKYCKMVVATYQFLEEGYDDPFIDTLVFALPRSKIQQVVGRCERTHEGKLTPLVVDIIDPFSIFKAMSWKRKKFYSSRGFKIYSK